MQVKIEDQSSIKKVLSFEIPKETISKELNKAYAELKKKADIKGFRKGKNSKEKYLKTGLPQTFMPRLPRA